MATPRQVQQLKTALAYDEADLASFTQLFLDAKVAVYIDTTLDLAAQHGYQLEDDLELSDDVLRALAAEAQRDARSVVATFNRDLEQLVERNAELDRDAIIDLYEQWAEARADQRAEMIAVSEAYPAQVDAQMAFYDAAGAGEVLFDFGGHGDADPVCPVCRALEETSPHPIERVRLIGTPHPNCRQDWHTRGEPDMADDVVLGAAPGGITGSDHLVGRFGDHDAAAAYIEELSR